MTKTITSSAYTFAGHHARGFHGGYSDDHGGGDSTAATTTAATMTKNENEEEDDDDWTSFCLPQSSDYVLTSNCVIATYTDYQQVAAQSAEARTSKMPRICFDVLMPGLATVKNVRYKEHTTTSATTTGIPVSKVSGILDVRLEKLRLLAILLLFPC